MERAPQVEVRGLSHRPFEHKVVRGGGGKHSSVEKGYIVEGPGEIVGLEGVDVDTDLDWGDEVPDGAVGEIWREVSRMKRNLRGSY